MPERKQPKIKNFNCLKHFIAWVAKNEIALIEYRVWTEFLRSSLTTKTPVSTYLFSAVNGDEIGFIATQSNDAIIEQLKETATVRPKHS